MATINAVTESEIIISHHSACIKCGTSLGSVFCVADRAYYCLGCEQSICSHSKVKCLCGSSIIWLYIPNLRSILNRQYANRFVNHNYKSTDLNNNVDLGFCSVAHLKILHDELCPPAKRKRAEGNEQTEHTVKRLCQRYQAIEPVELCELSCARDITRVISSQVPQRHNCGDTMIIDSTL